jgi:hypothetical protein
MTSESAALDRLGDPRRPTFEWRASTAFKAVVAFTAAVGAIVVAGTGQLPPAYLLVAIAASVACLLVTARGLDAGDGWAHAAAPAMLWILIGFGLVQVLIALGESRIEFPIGAILAVWAFRAPRSIPPAAVDRRRVQAVVGTFLVAHAALVVGPPLIGPTGPFAARQDDLNVSLAFDCGAATGGVPDKVPATFRWAWNRGEPFAEGIDGIAIAWTGQDTSGPDGAPGDPDAEDPGGLFVLAEPEPVLADGVSQGGGAVSSEQADAFFRGSGGGGTTFAVDLAVQQFKPGEIALTLRRASLVPVAHGYLQFDAVYVHLGRWTLKVRSTTGCRW